MLHKITVKPADQGFVRCFYWGDGTNPTPYQLNWTEKDGAREAQVDLDDGVNQITCEVIEGEKVEVNLDPASPIAYPPGEQWPVTRETTGHQNQQIFPLFFQVGGGA